VTAPLVPLVNGLLLGLGAAAPIGPVNIEIARRTLRFGRRAGFLLGCGAVTVDVCYAVITGLAVVGLVLQSPAVTRGLSLGGGIFLGYLAVGCLRSAIRGHEPFGERREFAAADAEAAEGAATDGGESRPPLPFFVPAVPRAASHYFAGLLMTALNPMTLGFWFAVTSGAAAVPEAARNPGTVVTGAAGYALPAVCAGVFAGALAWVVFFTTLVGRLRHFGGERWLRWADLAGGVTLLAFAGRAIWRVAHPGL
jgi:threonine/homoserine/homoserine lactone efflux protein